MAISVYLQSIDGKKLDEAVDLHNSMARLWPMNNSSFPLLQYVDPYGNAIFNGLQMLEIQKELIELTSKCSSEEQRTFLVRVHELATKCREHPHMFLRFRGD